MQAPRKSASCGPAWWWCCAYLVLCACCCSWRSSLAQLADPKFKAPILNVTAPVGREAMLTCTVEDLAGYKVAWLRVDTQTILTIANHVITKNHRIGVTHSELRTWYLHIKEVKETDRGWYMCQINTDPMKSQIGYLDVVVPPDIIDYQTSTDMVAREGSNVTLRCSATGSPAPTINWRREDGRNISLSSTTEVQSVEGSSFNLTKVSRQHMGPYLCIASNGVPPTVSKRITLIVQFPPMITIQNQLIGAEEGRQVTLECISEAYPKSINYWMRDQGEIVPQGGKFEPVNVETAYKVHMKLTIRSVSPSDFGAYKCISRNSLGDADGSIRLYRKPSTSGYYSSDGATKHRDKNVHKSLCVRSSVKQGTVIASCVSGKQRKIPGNSILEGSQDMLKEKNSHDHDSQEEEELYYEDSSATRILAGLTTTIALLNCLLPLCYTMLPFQTLRAL